MVDLLPCPFCGYPAILQERQTSECYASVSCSRNPCCSNDQPYPSEEQAIRAWNTRSPVEALTVQPSGMRSAENWATDHLREPLPRTPTEAMDGLLSFIRAIQQDALTSAAKPKSMHVSELSDEQLAAFEATRMPAQYDYLNAELDPASAAKQPETAAKPVTQDAEALIDILREKCFLGEQFNLVNGEVEDQEWVDDLARYLSGFRDKAALDMRTRAAECVYQRCGDGAIDAAIRNLPLSGD